MSKLLCNVLKISGRANAPPGCAPGFMSMPAVRLFVGSALTNSFGLACRGYTFDRSAFSKGLGFRAVVLKVGSTAPLGG